MQLNVIQMKGKLCQRNVYSVFYYVEINEKIIMNEMQDSVLLN
jgi:hypothetical protein